jgi:hypothetical protein
MPGYFPPALIITIKYDLEAIYYFRFTNPVDQGSPEFVTQLFEAWVDMDHYVNELRSAITARTPVFTGALRRHIILTSRTYKFEGQWRWVEPLNGYGYMLDRYLTLAQAINVAMNPTNPYSYALSVERGSRAHVPPLFPDGPAPSSLAEWASAHVMSPWGLQHHIAKHGKPDGVSMFANALLNDLPGIKLSSPLALAGASAEFAHDEATFDVEYTSGSYDGSPTGDLNGFVTAMQGRPQFFDLPG